VPSLANLPDAGRPTRGPRSRVPWAAGFVPLTILAALLSGQTPPAALRPTVHPPIPSSLDAAWLVPNDATRAKLRGMKAVADLASGVALYASGNAAGALPLVTQPSLDRSPLADYAAYYSAVARHAAGDVAGARASLRQLDDRRPKGFLSAATMMASGDAAMDARDFAAAAGFYERRVAATSQDRDLALEKWAEALEAAGETAKARSAWLRLYDELPTSPLAAGAKDRADALAGQTGEPSDARDRYARELARTDRLFDARRYAEALEGYEWLQSVASGDDENRIAVRIAASNVSLGRYRAAADQTAPFRTDGARQAEARFYHSMALRGLERPADYVAEVRALVKEFPESSWSEDALNQLATHHIRANEDGSAERIFRELYTSYPKSRHAPRAAWKYGWWSYRLGEFEKAARVFTQAAADFPRHNTRPAWIYWAGRAHDAMKRTDAARALYELVVADYRYSYYGSLASRRLRGGRTAAPRATLSLAASPRASIPTPGMSSTASGHRRTQTQSSADVGGDPPQGKPVGTPATSDDTETIRWLLAAGLYADASRELEERLRVERRTPVLEATLAWTHLQMGESLKAIAAMKNAYPQHLTASGDRLPRDVLGVIYPLEHWSSVKRYAAAHDLDPWLVIALIAQESGFDADVQSAAGAFGLMQLMPATGRQLARRLGIRNFSTEDLTDPEINIRLGTRYFTDLIDRWGSEHLALAAYNAGETPVARWIDEREAEDLDREEFIDDIPYPETQLYVKRVLGMREIYRDLYEGER
jgi:peptidoglycan lytic transglycosylase